MKCVVSCQLNPSQIHILDLKHAIIGFIHNGKNSSNTPVITKIIPTVPQHMLPNFPHNNFVLLELSDTKALKLHAIQHRFMKSRSNLSWTSNQLPRSLQPKILHWSHGMHYELVEHNVPLRGGWISGYQYFKPFKPNSWYQLANKTQEGYTAEIRKVIKCKHIKTHNT